MDSFSNIVMKAQILGGGITPPGGVPDDPSDVTRVIQIVITTAYSLAGVAAVAYLIYSGFMYMSSTGDPQKIQKAQQSMAYAVIGLVIVVVAGVVLEFVARLLGVENLILYLDLPWA